MSLAGRGVPCRFAAQVNCLFQVRRHFQVNVQVNFDFQVKTFNRVSRCATDCLQSSAWRA